VFFPTEEWFVEWVRVTNADRRFRSASKGWAGSVGLVVRRIDARDFYVRLDGADGRWTGVRVAASAALVDEADFVLSASLDSWRAILRQEIDPLRAIITGHVHARGQLSALLARATAMRVMTQLAAGLNTTFESTESQ
jgi:putative sterol carrier protein